MKFNIFLISSVFISICSILLCYHAFDAEPNEAQTECKSIEPNEPNMVSMAYVFDYEPLTTITIDCEDGNGVVIDYGGDEVVVTGANEEGAKIFFEYVKKYMDAYLESKAEPNDEIGEIVFEITDIPVPEALITFTGDGHNICLGEDAGLYLTDESYQFVVNVGGKMLQTTMTPEEYQMIYDVVNRAANEVKE